MAFMGITSVAAITVICYLMATGLKATPLSNKWLPSICGFLGGILGAVSFKYMPDYPATDIITAIAVGIVSGLAATGGYEAVHQFVKKSETESEG